MPRKEPERSKKGLAIVAFAAILMAAVGTGIYLWKEKGTKKPLTPQPSVEQPREETASHREASKAVGKPIVRPSEKVVDLDRLDKDQDLQAKIRDRKKEHGIGDSLDAIVQEDETIKVGDSKVPMKEILEKIRIKRGEIDEDTLADKEPPMTPEQRKKRIDREFEKVRTRIAELEKLIESPSAMPDKIPEYERFEQELEDLKELALIYRQYEDVFREIETAKQDQEASGGPGKTARAAADSGTSGKAAADSGTSGKAAADSGASGKAAADSGASGKAAADSGTSGKASADAGASGKASADAGASGKASTDAGASGKASADSGTSGKASADAGASGKASTDAGASGKASADAGASGKAHENSRKLDSALSFKKIGELELLRDNLALQLERALGIEKKPDMFGVHVVKRNENIWNIHFAFLKDYFENRGIAISPVADEPENGGKSSGVGKILKFAERIVYIYNVRERKLDVNLDLISPKSKIVVFRMEEIFAFLDELNLETVDRIRFDGENIWIPAES